MGLEGLVSKRRDRPYRGGRSLDWIKGRDLAGSDETFGRAKKPLFQLSKTS
jgi:ATP-dependent DNA ligase